MHAKLAILALIALAACQAKSEAPGTPDAAATDTSAPDTAPVDVPPSDAGLACTPGACPEGLQCDPMTQHCAPRLDEVEAQKRRKSCVFGKGATAAETLGKDVPIGKDLPFDHIVLTMMENRSFDHYFGAAKKLGWDVDGFPDGAGNPDAKGTHVPVFHATEACIKDVAHGWPSVHKQYNAGKMDGFLVTNDPGGERALGYFDQDDLTYYYGVAKAFGISDRHFCSVLGPTWINRFFYMGASSFGLTKNGFPPADLMNAHFDQQILAQLDAKGIDWRVYATDISVILVYFPYVAIEANKARVVPIAQFYVDAAAGNLPPVAFVEPTFSSISQADQDSEHPPGTPYSGEVFSWNVAQALMKSPLWPKTVFIQTYDEHGGFYDHVPPPEACEPDDLLPKDQPEKFDRYGIRVPLMVVSPWSKPGYVSHRVTDNTSPIRLVQTRFGLPALTRRDANAWPLLDFFDFSKPQMLTPPELPKPKLLMDKGVQDQVEACKVKFK